MARRPRFRVTSPISLIPSKAQLRARGARREKFGEIIPKSITHASQAGGGSDDEIVRSIALVDSAVDLANVSTYTFPDMSFGDAEAGDLLILGFAFRSGTAITVSSVTIGGITADAVSGANARNTSSGVSAAVLYQAVLPEDFTDVEGDVVITLSGNASRCGVALYAAKGVEGNLAYGAGTDTRAAVTGDMTATLSGFKDTGFAVGVAYSAGGTEQRIASAHVETTSDYRGQGFVCTSGNNDTTFPAMTEDVDVSMELQAAAPQAFALAGWSYKLDPPAVMPAEILAVGRITQPGFGAVSDSNGTDTSMNSRIAMYNELGTALETIKVHYGNFKTTGTTEAAGANQISIRAAVEYPAGVFTPLQFAGVRDIVLAGGAFGSSDALDIYIPSNHQFWIRTFVSVTAGGVWPRGYVINSSRGEAAETGTPAEKTTSGTITGSANAFGPLGVTATAFENNPLGAAVATIGDSISAGSGDGNYDLRGNTGWNGRASYNLIPHAMIAVGGTGVQNQATNFQYRLEMLKRLKVTHVVVGWGINDLNSGRSVAEVQADLQAMWNLLDTNGFKVWQNTITPRSTGSWSTLAGQTPTLLTQRNSLNAFLRTIPAPLEGIIDMALVTEATGGDAGKWKVEPAWAIDNYTQDGLHPNVTDTGSREGGHFVMADAAIPVFESWL